MTHVQCLQTSKIVKCHYIKFKKKEFYVVSAMQEKCDTALCRLLTSVGHCSFSFQVLELTVYLPST